LPDKQCPLAKPQALQYKRNDIYKKTR